LQSNINKVRRN